MSRMTYKTFYSVLYELSSTCESENKWDSSQLCLWFAWTYDVFICLPGSTYIHTYIHTYIEVFVSFLPRVVIVPIYVRIHTYIHIYTYAGAGAILAYGIVK